MSAMLISQLMLLPLLIFCLWLFFFMSPSGGRIWLYNLSVCALAILVSLAAVMNIAQSQSGANDDIWRPVLSIVSSYLIFPAILFIGGIVRMLLFSNQNS